jgi:hypothetical protein
MRDESDGENDSELISLQLRVIFNYAVPVRNYEISVVIMRICGVVFAAIQK